MPDEEEEAEALSDEEATLAEEAVEVDEDEAVIEDVAEESQSEEIEAPKLKDVVVEEWVHMNSQPPIWQR